MFDLREYFAKRRKEGEEPIIVTSEQIGEAFFAVYAPLLLEKGWSVYPQERTGRRLPARIEGEVIAWSQYQTERPSAALMKKWSLHARTSNVACIMGPSSGNALAIDIDVTDEELSVQIENLATTILGDTEYRRIGNAPKIMLFYRFGQTASFNKRTLRLAVEGDETVASEHMVEILAKNSTVTFYGRHHYTGSRFQWLEHTAKISPNELPLITEAQLAEFEEALGKLRAIYKPKLATPTLDVQSLPTASGRKRGVHPRNYADWIEDPVTGLITDGREKYLHTLCFELIRANPAQRYTEEDHKDLVRIAFDTFRAKADKNGRWGRDDFLLKEAGSRLNRAERDMEGGRISPNFRIVRQADGTEVYETPLPAAAASVFARMQDAGLEWLTGGKAFAPTNDRLKVDTANPADLLERQEQRKLITNRQPISDDVSSKCDRAADAIFRSIIDRQHRNLLRVLKAPTGSGKTSRVMRRLIEKLRKRPGTLKPGERIIFIVPKYENAEELCAHALDAGAEILRHDSEIPAGPADPDRPRVALWVGKKHTACPNKGQMDEMEKLDIAPGRVCQAGKLKCKIWADRQCQYHRQPDIYATASIVICVVSYLTMHSLPDALSKGAVALIVDEDPILNIVREFKLQLVDFKGWRLGTITPGLEALGYTINHVMGMRNEAVRVVTDAMFAGRDAAAALLDHKWTSRELNLPAVPGEHLLIAAKAVIEQTRAAELQIEPNMDVSIVKSILVQHEKSPKWAGMTAERHFWRVIADRMATLKEDRALHDVWKTAVGQAWDKTLQNVPAGVRADAENKAKKLEATPPRAKARGKTDARLQLRGHVDEAGRAVYTHIRISRRIETKFQDMPALLLDASAQVPLLKKVFGREVEEIPVAAPPHLRIAVCLDEVFSDASICPHEDDDFEAIHKKEARVRKIRLMITKTCDRYAPDRVLLVASQAVLAVLLHAWKVPQNLDWMYYGNLRGLDGAKRHAAIITVGRSQMPPEVVDAKAAAITFDDDEPEAPFDLMGTGRTADGQQIRRPAARRAMHLRNGHDIIRNVPTMPGERGRQIETAWREEELRQAVGRLRTIHRGGETIPPVWIAIGGAAIPEDFIIDEIFNLEDGVADAAAADERRLSGEIKSDKPALKLAAKRAEIDLEHADLELLVKQVRSDNEKLPTMEVHRLAKLADMAIWRRNHWPRLGLSQSILDLIDAPEALVAMGLDLADLDERAFRALERAAAEEAVMASDSEPVTEGYALIDIVAPTMTTPEIVRAYAANSAEDGGLLLTDDEFEAFLSSA